MPRRISCLFILALTSGGSPALSQEVPAVSQRNDSWDLPAAVADEVVRYLNDPATRLVEGVLDLPPRDTVVGNLAVLEGTLTLAGRVEGNVLVVNGDASFLPGSAVTGSLLVVGGAVAGIERGSVRGEIRVYPEALELVRDGTRISRPARRVVRSIPPAGTGSSDFLITTGRSYNRVEGLPISFGPRLITGGSNPLRLQALAIFRTEAGWTFDPDRMGYYVRADQYFGGHRDIRAGGTLHSLIDPIEAWHLTDLESGLATFFFHRDYRDHYQRQGGTLFAGWEPGGKPYSFQLETRWEKHGTVESGSPWSLLRNAEPWRPQPVIAEGSLGSVAVESTYDSRSHPWNPSTGWLATGRLENGFRVKLAHPAMVGDGPEGEPVLGPEYGRFLTGLMDVRRYNRIDADSRLNVRLVAGGSLTGRTLPPQRQHALGGEGSLPGYSVFDLDCGARESRVRLSEHRVSGSIPFHPQYGCDAFTILQTEFRGKLSFRLRWDTDPWRDDRDGGERPLDFGWDMAPDWAIFVDAGRGWTFHDRPDERGRVDVGAGLLLERVGLYLALPLTGGSGVNLFVRLGPRF